MITDAWVTIAHDDAGTQLDSVVIGGEEYRRELITFDVEAYG
jgi:hypothetical protein